MEKIFEYKNLIRDISKFRSQLKNNVNKNKLTDGNLFKKKKFLFQTLVRRKKLMICRIFTKQKVKYIR